ncbi:unnamed protein product [Didymodactylos carnosus]|uniref:Uncharacterized protein n=1 Tax=Didymodactylos carnosus TaxID=1234261 RepID=A0A813YX20_9BILA|nr:unnamed protein product [Didymodactylos carnosus]CAF3674494.1 unnamed protein product [Didymodactylos carnosus]
MAIARYGYSYRSNEYMSDLFKTMFPDSRIATDFVMRSKKVSYVIAHGISVYFHDELVKDVKKSNGYSLIYDETTTVGVKKQLDIYLRYWSEEHHGVVVRYFKSILLGHATGAIISKEIIDSLKTDGIDIKKLLMLGRDNPNVNKTVENIIDKEIMNERRKQLSSNNGNDDQILDGLFRIGSRSAARREDFVCVAESICDSVAKVMLRFVNTRWIEIGNCIERVLQQWDIIAEYFLVFMPQHCKSDIENCDRYRRVKLYLTSTISKIRLEFLLYISRTIFKKFLTWFQQEGPLVHMLYDQCSDLLKTVCLSFIKKDVIENKTVDELLNLSFDLQNNHQQNSTVEIGEMARKSLNKLTIEEKKQFFVDVRSFYCKITKELIRTLPLKNKLLKDLKCIQPSMRNEDESSSCYLRLARSMPQLTSTTDIDRLKYEWISYTLETIPNEWIVKSKFTDDYDLAHVVYHSMDYYWNKVFLLTDELGVPKYNTTAKLVKCLLSLSHGNADVERGVSENRNIISDDRSLLNQASINGLRTTSSAVRLYGDGQPHKMPISKLLLSVVSNSSVNYQKYLEQQKKILHDVAQSNKNNEKKDIVEKETDLLDVQKLLQQQFDNAQKYLHEGNERLKHAIQNRDFNEVDIAQMFIENSNTKLMSIREEIVENNDELNKLRKKLKK